MTGIRDVEKLFLYARSDCPKQPLGVIGRDEAVIITVTDQDGAGNPSNGIHGANRSRIIPSPNADQGSLLAYLPSLERVLLTAQRLAHQAGDAAGEKALHPHGVLAAGKENFTVIVLQGAPRRTYQPAAREPAQREEERAEQKTRYPQHPEESFWRKRILHLQTRVSGAAGGWVKWTHGFETACPASLSRGRASAFPPASGRAARGASGSRRRRHRALARDRAFRCAPPRGWAGRCS